MRVTFLQESSHIIDNTTLRILHKRKQRAAIHKCVPTEYQESRGVSVGRHAAPRKIKKAPAASRYGKEGKKGFFHGSLMPWTQKGQRPSIQPEQEKDAIFYFIFCYQL
jgi:hypothetical protein